MYMACNHGFIDVAEYLIGQGLDVSISENSKGKIAIAVLPIKGGHNDLFDLVVNNGASIYDKVTTVGQKG